MSAERGKRFEVITRGTCRVVILTEKYAFKLPRFWRLPARLAGSSQSAWRVFIRGVTANMQEVEFGYSGWPELCPVLWHVNGGFLVVMPRVDEVIERTLPESEFYDFIQQPDYTIPGDPAPGNFGMYQGRMVAIDYGS